MIGPAHASVQRVHRPDAELHAERRGAGPPILLICGAGGDARMFVRTATALATDRAVMTYDRRGNSRSPRRTGWSRTTVAEQADDAAAVLHAFTESPATVFGTSSGGVIALELARRHPGLVAQLLIHEPALLSLRGDYGAVLEQLRSTLASARCAHGDEHAFTSFLGMADAPGWAAADPETRAGMLGNAAVFLDVEFAPLSTYVLPPGRYELDRRVAVLANPADALVAPIAAALAQRARVKVTQTGFGHLGYLNEPEAVAASIRDAQRR